MFRIILFILNILLCPAVVEAQCEETPISSDISGNAVLATISNGGDLFFDGNEGRFITPVEIFPWRTTIFAAGLWLGGYDEDQNLKVAAQSYGRAFEEFDFAPSPLNYLTGEPYENLCVFFNKIWKVEKQDIFDHIADFQDNGVIDDPIPSIFAWPGNNNDFCFDYNFFFLPFSPQEWAPFYDKNNNDKYEPDLGEYPHPDNVIPNLIPEEISWTVFNDNTTHLESFGEPLLVEIQLTSWNFDCLDNHALEYSLFTSHKIINRSQQDIDSLYVGLWVDFDNGCPLDDYIGCSPENDGFLVYNSDELDGQSSPNDCGGVNTYGYNPPAQSVAFLNKKLDKFMYFNSSPGIPPPNPFVYPPETPAQYYGYLKGRWTNGMPLTYGGTGFDISGNGTPTDYAFPDNPNDEDGWSLYTEEAPNSDLFALGSTYAGKLGAGDVFKLDMSHTYHGYSTLDHLGSANQAYVELALMQQMYDMKFNSWCDWITNGVATINDNSFEVFPNPSRNVVNIQSHNGLIDQVEIFDISGRLVSTKIIAGNTFAQLDIAHFPTGVYFLKISNQEKTTNVKIVKQ